MEKFVAVKVVKGRKFRGEAYDIGAQVYTSTFNIWGHGKGGWRSCESIKLWSPTAGFVYANPNYIEDVTDKPEAEVQADYAKYVDCTINDTIAWCRKVSKGKGEQEIINFARNVIRKHHPEMMGEFESRHGGVDVVGVVESTVAWALNLGYSTAKCVRIAARALSKKGVTSNEAFTAAWTITLDLRGLSRFVEKYNPAIAC